MYKKTITYNDYNGEERKDEYYFNLSKAELFEMEMSVKGGFSSLLDKIIKTQDTPALMANFKTLILKSYGEKSIDGRRFIKSDELSTAFSQTEAYSELLIELVTNDGAAADFVNNVFPNDYSDIAPSVSNDIE